MSDLVADYLLDNPDHLDELHWGYQYGRRIMLEEVYKHMLNDDFESFLEWVESHLKIE